LPVGDPNFRGFENAGARRMLIAAAACLAGLCVAMPPAAAQDPSPGGNVAPTAFADEDFQPVQSIEALKAATSAGAVNVAQDAGANPDGDAVPGEPLNLAPLADPIDPFAEPGSAAPAPFPSEAPIDLTAPGTGTADPLAPGDAGILGSYTLEARMTAEGPPLESGVIWRVFADDAGADGKMRLVGVADGGPVTLKLKPGEYFVHAAFGRAGLTRRVTISETPQGETVILNAGGIRLTALAGQDRAIAPEDVRFDIFAPDDGGSDGRVAVMENAPPGTIIGLGAGIYHVVCRYGDANAVVRADIRVEPGKLTEATVYQQAARVTLKLVESRGGEALANTAWSVVTPAGESVIESVGAFPSVVLSAGQYTAIAKHEDKIFEQDFTVEAGLNRDVEVLLQ